MNDLEIDAEIKVLGVFVILGIALGVIFGLTSASGRWTALVALVNFYFAYKLSSTGIDFVESSYDGDAKSIIKTGIIPYWFLLLVSWTFVYTLTMY